MKKFKPPIAASTGKPCKMCVARGALCARYHGGVKAPPTLAADDMPSTHHGFATVSGLCNGLKKDKSGLCTQRAGRGTTHKGAGRCEFHGGSSPSGKKHGNKLMAIAACAKFGIPIPVGPFQALLDLVASTNGEMHFYRAQVQALVPEAMVFGVSRETTRQFVNRAQRLVTEQILEHRAGANEWLKLYHASQVQHRDACVAAIKCGLAERLVSGYEQTGRKLALAMRKLLEALGLEADADALAKARTALLEADEDEEDVIDAEVVNE